MQNTTEITKEYFIEKLQAIPDENWIDDGDLYDEKNPLRGCLLFHLGVKNIYEPTEEALALSVLIKSNLEKLAKHITICEVF